MANYHITYDRDKKRWKIIKAGATRASTFADTQEEAQKIAKRLSSNQGGGEVRIHRKDNNKIRDSDTVKPGNDPKDIPG